MKVLPRLAASLAALSLLLPQSALAASYPDLPEDHWAYASMDRAASLGILTGYSDGSMAPDDTLTWGQYLVMLCRAFYPKEYAALTAAGTAWDQAGYQTACASGLIYHGDFLLVTPDALSEPIHRQDAAVLLSRVLPEEETDSPYAAWWQEPKSAAEDLSDFSTLAPNYQEAVQDLYDLRIIFGKGDGSFGGDETIRRADGSVLLLRTMDVADERCCGTEKTVTLHIVDASGEPLAPDQVVETQTFQWLSSIVDADLLQHYTLAEEQAQYHVSLFQDEYTLVYRPYTRAEIAEASFWSTVEQGEATFEEYYDQDFWLWTQGENERKHVLLFGDAEKRRYVDKAEAEAHMTTITVPIWTLDQNGEKAASTTSLAINAALADDVTAIFTEIFNDPEQFPIRDLGGYDWRGDSAKGEHNCGTAIDINYNENYQVRDGQAMVGSHWKPGEDPYSIPTDGSVVRIFAEHGWSWGGNAWAEDDDQTVGYHDYMHFSYMGT